MPNGKNKLVTVCSVTMRKCYALKSNNLEVSKSFFCSIEFLFTGNTRFLCSVFFIHVHKKHIAVFNTVPSWKISLCRETCSYIADDILV